MLTPTKLPFRKACPVDGSRFPKRIPMAIDMKIQTTKNLSRKDSILRGVFSASWFGGSSTITPSLLFHVLKGYRNEDIPDSLVTRLSKGTLFSMS
jgi:hypothetical protein